MGRSKGPGMNSRDRCLTFGRSQELSIPKFYPLGTNKLSAKKKGLGSINILGVLNDVPLQR